jgi:aspartate/methionine/tyrosine aminotransferase
MTGWRLGWAIGSPELILLAGKLQEPMISCPRRFPRAPDWPP